LVSRIFPLERFAEICRKVYFAVDDYSEVDLILVNGYLSYMFAEHVVVSGLADYEKYYRLCSKNFRSALSRLPLLLPASMEVAAVLTLGVRISSQNKGPGPPTNTHGRLLARLRILKLQWLGLLFRLHRVFARR